MSIKRALEEKEELESPLIIINEGNERVGLTSEEAEAVKNLILSSKLHLVCINLSECDLIIIQFKPSA